MKVYRVHEIVNYFHPTEYYNGLEKTKAINYGQMMHEKIQQRMLNFVKGLQCEYEVNYLYKNKAIIQGHIDMINIKESEVIIYEIKPVISWLQITKKYDMQLNIYMYLVKKVLNKPVKANYILYYKGKFRKLPFLSRYSDERIEQFIDEFLEAKLKLKMK